MEMRLDTVTYWNWKSTARLVGFRRHRFHIPRLRNINIHSASPRVNTRGTPCSKTRRFNSSFNRDSLEFLVKPLIILNIWPRKCPCILRQRLTVVVVVIETALTEIWRCTRFLRSWIYSFFLTVGSAERRIVKLKMKMSSVLAVETLTEGTIDCWQTGKLDFTRWLSLYVQRGA